MFRGVGSDILTPGTPFIYGPGTPQGIISAQRCYVLFLSSTVERIGRFSLGIVVNRSQWYEVNRIHAGTTSKIPRVSASVY